MDTLRHRLVSSCNGIALAAALLVALAAAPSPAALVAQVPPSNVPTADSLRHVTPLVTFVFGGTVLQRDTVENPTLTASARTARVKVDRVLSCPREVGDYSGEVVTVYSMPPGTPPPQGARAIFFASGWSVGKTVAVNARYAFVPASLAQENALLWNFLHAIHLDSTAALQAQVRASSLSAIIRIDSSALLPQPLTRPGAHEHPQRWSLVYATVDSSFPTSTFWAGKPVVVLAPLTVAYTELYKPLLRSGDARLALLHATINVPQATTLAPKATFFIPQADNLRPVQDATMLGGARPRGVFNAAPLSQCNADPLAKK